MRFDLKKFREREGYKQNAFADLLGYKQPVISRMENGDKPVSDKLLMKIETHFKINLDRYKKYERNKTGLYKPYEYENKNEKVINQLTPPSDLLSKYTQLLEQKSELDKQYYSALPEEKSQNGNELSVAEENNLLLRKIALDIQELLFRFKALEKI